MLLVLASCAGTSGTMPTETIDLYKFSNMEVFDYPGITQDNYEYNHDLNIINDNYRNYYELLVGTFCDSDGDGMGDLNGVTKKLDYISDLGFNGIWLMPIFPSPTYHKYDATDYKGIDSDFGTMEDFDKLIDECDKRGIKVIIDLALNHTSNLHPWFLEATAALSRGDTSNQYVQYYNFAQSSGANYHSLGNGWYYEGVFWSGMPDLNMDCQALRDEIKDIVSFWLNKGVGGFRYDAVKHVYQSDEDNIEFFTWLNSYCKSIDENFYAVAEIWDTAVRIAKYYATGMSSFNYPFGGDFNGKYLKTAGTGGAGEYTDALIDWQNRIRNVSADAIDAPFLTNHDNMRTCNLLFRSLEAQKMAAALYLMSPGATFTYYGEEIGMISKGSANDPNKRLPMQWSSDPSELTDLPEGAEVFAQFYPAADVQMNYTNSLYATYKRALRIRNENPEIARGTLKKLHVGGEEISAYRSTYNGSSVIIIHNLQTQPQTLKLEKSKLGYEKIRGYLSGTGESFYFDGENITFPAYSTLILK